MPFIVLDEDKTFYMRTLKRLAKEQNKCVIIATHSKNGASYVDEVIELQKINKKG